MLGVVYLAVTEMPQDRENELINRRSGIEPLIGHVKQRGQLDRSRMKSDQTIESSGFASILGFRQTRILESFIVF